MDPALAEGGDRRLRAIVLLQCAAGLPAVPAEPFGGGWVAPVLLAGEDTPGPMPVPMLAPLDPEPDWLRAFMPPWVADPTPLWVVVPPFSGLFVSGAAGAPVCVCCATAGSPEAKPIAKPAQVITVM